MPIVNTVALVISKGGRILVEKRKLTKSTDPGKIVIPGGHVEKGETLEQACKRELKEEFGLNCDEFIFIERFSHHTEIENQLVNYFLCSKWSGKMKFTEAEKVFWLGKEELNTLDFEIDRKAARKFFSKN